MTAAYYRHKQYFGGSDNIGSSRKSSRDDFNLELGDFDGENESEQSIKKEAMGPAAFLQIHHKTKQFFKSTNKKPTVQRSDEKYNLSGRETIITVPINDNPMFSARESNRKK
jgi:hypothetical protein